MEHNMLKIIERDNEVILMECPKEAYGEYGEIVIPKGVTKIDGAAFGRFSAHRLTRITIPESVTSIEEGTFVYCNQLKSIIVKKGNMVYDSRENCNAIIKSATNTLVVGCRNTHVPDGVTSIADYACIGNSKITIPNSVNYIGYCAFRGVISVLDFKGSIPKMNVSYGGFDGCTIDIMRVNTPRKNTNIPFDIKVALERSDKGEVIYAAPELCKEASLVPGYIRTTLAKNDELIDLNTQFIMSVEPYELERYSPLKGSLITMISINKEHTKQVVVYEPCDIVLKKIEDAIESLSQKLGGVSGLMDLLKFLCEKKMQ